MYRCRRQHAPGDLSELSPCFKNVYHSNRTSGTQQKSERAMDEMTPEQTSGWLEQAGLNDLERANVAIIDGFLAAWNRRDIEGVLSFLAEETTFAAGPVDGLPQLSNPAPLYEQFIAQTRSIKMTVKPGSTRAVGPIVTHERVDEMVMKDGSDFGSGTWFAVFALQEGKIVSFIDYQIDGPSLTPGRKE